MGNNTPWSDLSTLENLARISGIPYDELITRSKQIDPEKLSQEAIEKNTKNEAQRILTDNSAQEMVKEKYIFERKAFSSYIVGVNPEWNIWYINFHYGKYKFRVSVQTYKYSSTWYKNYQEKNGTRQVVPKLDSLKLWLTQRKMSAGYSSQKRSQNFWILFDDMVIFARELIKQYHRDQESL